MSARKLAAALWRIQAEECDGGGEKEEQRLRRRRVRENGDRLGFEVRFNSLSPVSSSEAVPIFFCIYLFFQKPILFLWGFSSLKCIFQAT